MLTGFQQNIFSIILSFEFVWDLLTVQIRQHKVPKLLRVSVTLWNTTTELYFSQGTESLPLTFHCVLVLATWWCSGTRIWRRKLMTGWR